MDFPAWDLKKLKWIGIFLLVLGIVWVVITQFIFRPTLITVVGEGRVKVKPQTVSFTLTLVNEGNTPTLVLADNNQLVRNIISVIKSAGATDEDIIISYPQIVSPNPAAGQTTYQAVNAVGVTLKDVSAFDNLVTRLYAEGARNISNVVFTTQDSKELEKKAVEEAISDAKKRAREIARSLGKRIIRMVSVTTTEVGAAGAVAGQAPRQETLEGQFNNSPSQIEIVRQASIVFELR